MSKAQQSTTGDTNNVVNFAAARAARANPAPASTPRVASVELAGERVLVFASSTGEPIAISESKYRRMYASAVRSLPFVTLNENGGYGGNWWSVDAETANDAGAHARGREWAGSLVDAMLLDKAGDLPLYHTMSAIIDETVARRVKGGKGSQVPTRAVYGFLVGLSERVSNIASANTEKDDHLVWLCDRAAAASDAVNEARAKGKGRSSERAVKRLTKVRDQAIASVQRTRASTFAGLQAKVRLMGKASGGIEAAATGPNVVSVLQDILEMQGGR